MALATRRFRRELKPRDGFLLVTLSWVLMSASAAIPLMIALPDLSFTDAYFESMSGLTTTGSTVLNHLDDLPQSINLWRHTLHWIGGIGIIVLVVAVLPLLGVGGMQLYKAETPGPVKDEKLTPRITETAKALWFTYLAITVAGVIGSAHRRHELVRRDLSRIFGDRARRLLHARRERRVISTRSPSSSCSSSSWSWRRSISRATSSRSAACRSSLTAPIPKARPCSSCWRCSVVLVSVLLAVDGTYPTTMEGFRHSVFNVVSIATTTGFVTEDYEKWPAFLPVWLLFLSCITCSTGSTGGGIKMFRTLLLVRQARRELKLLVHPSAVIPIRIGGSAIPERVAYSVLAFIFLYFGTILVLTFALLATGLDLVSSFSAAVGSMNNVGPGLGAVGPSTNFSALTDAQTWICTLAMLIGRLEIFSVLVLFTATFWRK